MGRGRARRQHPGGLTPRIAMSDGSWDRPPAGQGAAAIRRRGAVQFMEWREFRGGLIGGLAAIGLLAAGVILFEQHEAQQSLERQVDAVRERSRAGRQPSDARSDPGGRGGAGPGGAGRRPVRTSIRRRSLPTRAISAAVTKTSGGSIWCATAGSTHTDRPAASADSFARVESRLAPSEPMAAAAMQKGSAVMNGTVQDDGGRGRIRLCAADLCAATGNPIRRSSGASPASTSTSTRSPVRLACATSGENIAWRCGWSWKTCRSRRSRATRRCSSRGARGAGREPASLASASKWRRSRSAGWIEGAPRRWMIRGIGGAIALFAGGLVLMLASGRSGPGGARADMGRGRQHRRSAVGARCLRRCSTDSKASAPAIRPAMRPSTICRPRQRAPRAISATMSR